MAIELIHNDENKDWLSVIICKAITWEILILLEVFSIELIYNNEDIKLLDNNNLNLMRSIKDSELLVLICKAIIWLPRSGILWIDKNIVLLGINMITWTQGIVLATIFKMWFYMW